MRSPTPLLRAGLGARIKYAMGGTPFRVGIAAVLAAALAGGAVAKGPELVDGFLEVTGLISEEDVAEREALAVELVKLEDAVAEAELFVEPEAPDENVEEAWDEFTAELKSANSVLRNEEHTSQELGDARRSLNSAEWHLEASIEVQEKAEAEKKLEAEKKKKAKAAAKKKAAEKKAAEEAAAKEAQRQREAQQQQAPPPQQQAPAPAPNNSNSGGGGGGGGGGATRASNSLQVPCATTVTASGGGTVNISGGGKSSSGSGSASITLSGPASVTASAVGSVSISTGAC